jgi:chloramphenicol-sensitive protein RarD
MTAPRNQTHIGIAMGIGAYVLWGVLPLFIRLLHPVTPPGILSHRVIWSLAILAVLALALKRWGHALAAVRRPRVALALCGSTLMIACNWLLYIYAVNGGHTLQASLGYFINPLLNVLLGVVFLRERLGRLELIAVMLAAVGVAALTIELGAIPYIPLGLAFSFGTYGLIRKMIGLGPVEGMLVETALLGPFALFWLLTQPILPTGAVSPPLWTLMMSGVITTAPLLLFAGAANRIRYSDLGLLQYIGPTLQLLIAVQLFGEPLLPVYKLAFGFIWSGLLVYIFATWQRGRATPALPE